MKPPLTTEARKTPRVESMRLARNAGNIVVDDPLPASFAERLEVENQVLTEALEESERLRKLSVVLVTDFHALRASEERLAIALSEAQRDLELGSPINAATTIRRALQRPTP